MLYKITFYYTEPATGQSLKLTGIKAGDDPSEAKYYFMKQYQHHKINITKISPI